MKSISSIRNAFLFKIIIPILMAIALFAVSIFYIIIPSFEKALFGRKREMILELTYTAWSVLEEFEQMEREGTLTRESAQRQAMKHIQYLRYGAESKDYFWITDFHPMMIMHPYQPELNNTDLTQYRDREGKLLFIEFVNKVRKDDHGFVEYMWQWKDDPNRIVPKLSYVRGFEPWGWIIGTGIYIEDVKAEIAALTSHLIKISLVILLIMIIVLLFVVNQSLKIEKRKQIAEEKLRGSEVKYRTLVEASTEGLVMMLDGEYTYANQKMYNLLGYDQSDMDSVSPSELLTGNLNADTSVGMYFAELAEIDEPEHRFEGKIYRKDGQMVDLLLYISDISFADKIGYAIIIEDISTQKKVIGELDQSQIRFNNLTNNISMGIFRCNLGLRGRFIETNEAMLGIFGYKSRDELFKVRILDLFHEPGDRHSFLRNLMNKGAVRNSVIRITKRDGSSSHISISAVLVKNDTGKPVFCDGIVEDITQRIRVDEHRENLLSELQISLNFLNLPIRHFAKDIIVCDMHEPIHKVATEMSKRHYSAVILSSAPEKYCGIITDKDLRERAVSRRYDLDKPVFELMTSPLISIQDSALVFEALALMRQSSTGHLVIRSIEGDINGIISTEELMQVQHSSSSLLLKELEVVESVDEIIRIHDRLPVVVKALVNSGSKIRSITRTISSVSDSIVQQLIGFAISKLGDSPVPFAFIAMGSEGREEQTLITDQDNAIIFEDVEPEKSEEIYAYFHKLGTMVCNWLNECGYVHCKGNNMAMNPKWSQPIKQWENYFTSWIDTTKAQDLVEFGIFFDFRCVYGDRSLTLRLRDHIFKTADTQPRFFQLLTRNCLSRRPPISLLGNIIVTSSGDHPETFDIKQALMPISDFARIYVLKSKIMDTNTLDRLKRLVETHHLKRDTWKEMVHAYCFLMQLRFKHQTDAISRHSNLNNFINPASLTHVERKMLKNSFSLIGVIQKKLGYDFTGEAL
ncbi:DUF294 nucleotidyltransferase-like domain-containing protein [bacterium]|nr:DUF294 nucleotidyltransferase-like domain-containing protein [bacterium]